MSRSVIVVGAGIAGLTAAFRLQQRGFQVKVLEAGDQPGGRVAQGRAGPIPYNTGARLLYPFGSELQALIDELGLRDTLVPLRNLGADCRTDDATYRVDLMPGFAALRTLGLGWRDRAGLLRSGLHLAWLRGRTDPDHAASALAYDDVTLADYIRKVAGPRVLERLVEPVFRGTRSWNPEDISASFYLSTTPSLLGRDTVHVPRGGMGRLTAALAEKLAIEYGAQVTGIMRAAPAASVVRYRQGDGELEAAADIVVCATQGQYAGKLVSGQSDEERALLDAVRYNSLGIVHYALRGELAPALEFSLRSRSTRIATWQQMAAPADAGEAKSILYCQLTPEAVREAQEQGCTDDVDRLLRAEIRARIPGFDRRLVYRYNQWIACKLPVFYPGYGRKVARFLAWQGADRRGVYYCGDYLAQSLVNGACRSGAEAAAAIARHWR
ncbi:FAD-dependent oxidoreductase [Pigmentiphaga sp. GD03639]|uniref:protoporphyrinogen/coproporphyrinogen oxidase n=1 Tax=unclassified Pigmentiphaga TaxID=2626614 RepID=UPI00244C719C|nr:FAD-dependent oxidoreductase [Pigmentiphaga sp. GD03639]MDH2235115.1 FAD-dependent oxidoreductase [Pigmentiphaga sp. GD03639]